MKVSHVGFVRKSRSGRALKLDLSLQAILEAQRYKGKDGKEYVNLIVSVSRILDILENRKEVTAVNQVGADK